MASGKAHVHYIDYGNREVIPSTRLASLPAAYSADSAFAHEYSLPYVSLPKDEEFKELGKCEYVSVYKMWRQNKII